MKQADIERITRIVVTPLEAIYGPYASEVKEMLLDDLHRFDNRTLEEAVRIVRRTRQTQPKIAHLVEACREAGGGAKQSEGSNEFLKQLNRRNDSARKMAWDYRVQFEATPLARDAKAGGWFEPLVEYVTEAASLQSQLIAGLPNAGFSHTALRAAEFAETERRCFAFVTACKRQAQAGFIDVNVPQHMIDEWAGIASRRNPLLDAQPPKPALAALTFSTVPPPKTQLEIYIEQKLAEMDSRA